MDDNEEHDEVATERGTCVSALLRKAPMKFGFCAY
jgi:hypothetical protein